MEHVQVTVRHTVTIEIDARQRRPEVRRSVESINHVQQDARLRFLSLGDQVDLLSSNAEQCGVRLLLCVLALEDMSDSHQVFVLSQVLEVGQADRKCSGAQAATGIRVALVERRTETRTRVGRAVPDQKRVFSCGVGVLVQNGQVRRGVG
jgi:hypothetical protein